MAKNEKQDGFNTLMFKRLWKILKIIFPKLCSIPTILFLFLVIISFLEQYVAYQVGLIASYYYKALGDRDFQNFLHTTLISTLLVIGMALVLTTKTYTADILYITWRKILCKDLHKLYFSGINFYSLNVLRKVLDNPDQRMTQDVDKLCRLLSTITITIIVSPFKISYYTYKTYEGTGWQGPVFVFSFFCFGTILNKLLMSPIVKYYMNQEKCEGDYRFKHMHIRVNSESVAFHVSGLIELHKTDTYLRTLVKTQRKVFNRQYWLNLVQNAFDYMGSIVSYCVIAIPIFDGTYDGIGNADLSSLISKNSFLCMTLMYSFSQLVDLTSSVVALSGVTHRVSQLIERLYRLQEEWDMQTLQVSSSFTNLTQNRQVEPSVAISAEEKRNLLDDSPISEIISNDVAPIKIAFILSKVTITAPETDRILIKDLSIEICKNEHVLIMGPSSCGKSSLLRILRGLWAAKNGTVAHNFPPGPNSVIFLPQKPLMTNGSLYEQIIYPHRFDPDSPPGSEVCLEISELLNKVLLHGLLQRCGGLLNDPDWSWDDVLSPGEMQRICFLRLFYHKPQYAFLDESTSALSLEVEDFLYFTCLDLGITLVSVGHRHSLAKYHNKMLNIAGDGSWTISNIIYDPTACNMRSYSSPQVDSAGANLIEGGADWKTL